MDTTTFELKSHSSLLAFFGFDQVIAQIGAASLLSSMGTDPVKAHADFCEAATTALGENKGRIIAERWATYTFEQQRDLLCMADTELLKRHLRQHIALKLQETGVIDYGEDFLRFETDRCDCIKILHGRNMYANSAEESFKFLLGEAIEENLTADERQLVNKAQQQFTDLELAAVLCGPSFMDACKSCSRSIMLWRTSNGLRS